VTITIVDFSTEGRIRLEHKWANLCEGAQQRSVGWVSVVFTFLQTQAEQRLTPGKSWK
jgi:hypothetical protein